MSRLGDAQEQFSYMLGDLLCWCKGQGIRVRMLEGYAPSGTGHKKDSNHYLKLAQDIYTEKDEDHKRMHDAWDALGGAPRIEDDMNHYSLKWEGRW